MADWAELSPDLLIFIHEKFNLIEDSIAFRSVCKSWMSAAREKQHLRPQIPWLVLPDEETKENHHRRPIYSLSKESILAMNLCIPEMCNKRCIGLNYGWILTISRKGEMNLLHPLSRSQIQLPHQRSLDYYKEGKCQPRYASVPCAALSGNPSLDEFVLMIAFGENLHYWRLREKRWTRITNPTRLYRDLTYYKDKFCILDCHGKIWACSVSDPQDITLFADLSYYSNDMYVVESEGDLLVVVREHENNEDRITEEEIEYEDTDTDSDSEERMTDTTILSEITYRTSEFKVYKFDRDEGGFLKIKSLGNRAIFVGHNNSISFDVLEFPRLIKANHIYFTDDKLEGYVLVKKGGGKDMGSYNLEDGLITKFQVDESVSRSPISPPFWFIPSL